MAGVTSRRIGHATSPHPMGGAVAVGALTTARSGRRSRSAAAAPTASAWRCRNRALDRPRDAGGGHHRGDQPHRRAARSTPGRAAARRRRRSCDVADDLPVIDVHHDRRQHADRRQQEIAVPHAAQRERVVQQHERHDRRQPQQEHHPQRVADHGAAHGGHARIAIEPAQQPRARQRRREPEHRRRAEHALMKTSSVPRHRPKSAPAANVSRKAGARTTDAAT